MDILVSKLKTLADPTRLAILEFLRDPIQSCCSREDGVCGCDLESFLGLSQPTISHHMKLLAREGFVRAEKRGRWVYYDLHPNAFDVVITYLGTFQQLAQQQAAARQNACCDDGCCDDGCCDDGCNCARDGGSRGEVYITPSVGRSTGRR
ncbi:MAG: metalloregulator ArsR/SmtB family transcription factor [Trueperaceae bacterium]|nr:metalloregulator ArsR/SmtB family transcription factor [Trueperaceae bacterium]